jgi:hypothetical protein
MSPAQRNSSPTRSIAERIRDLADAGSPVVADALAWRPAEEPAAVVAAVDPESLPAGTFARELAWRDMGYRLRATGLVRFRSDRGARL